MSSPTVPVAGGAPGRRPRVAPGAAADTTRWQRVVLPAEHGGWGLTLEPVLLGLLAAWSVAGLCLGVAAMLAFLVRTPLKLAAVDVRREADEVRAVRRHEAAQRNDLPRGGARRRAVLE